MSAPPVTRSCRPGRLALAALLGALSACASAPPRNQGSGMIHPGQPWLDQQGRRINAHGAGLLQVGDATYWYGEIKGEGAEGNTAQVGVSVYRSHDLVHWQDLGVALAVSQRADSPIARGAIIERPKVLRRADGQYVMWFHLERAGHGYRDAMVGVALAGSPQGPFRFVRAFQPNGQQSRDMTLFQDDDGQAYLFYSSEDNDTLHITRLRPDRLGTEPDYSRAFAGECLEAPAVFKSSGRYFFVGSTCTGWKPNAAHGAVADSPLGPWRSFGNPAQGSDAALTFHSQSAYVLPLPGQPSRFVYIGDRWTPQHPIDGGYIWLPLTVEGERFRIDWRDAWNPHTP